MTELTITFADGGKLTVEAESWELTRADDGQLKLAWTAAPGEPQIDTSGQEITAVYARPAR